MVERDNFVLKCGVVVQHEQQPAGVFWWTPVVRLAGLAGGVTWRPGSSLRSCGGAFEVEI